MALRDILGHEREIELLTRAYSNGRLAHGMIFSGPEGVGKKKVAFEFAKLLNCQNSTDLLGNFDSCGECESCYNFDAGSSLNLIEVLPEEGKTIITVSTIRETLSDLRYAVGKGLRFVLIDNAENLNTQAANAFLKTLEEPPKNTHIIIITGSFSELLPTVISRCQHINFKPLKAVDIEKLLIGSFNIDEETARFGAALSNGSLKKALMVCDEEFLDTYLQALSVLTGVIESDNEALLDLSEKIGKAKEGVDDFLDTLKDLIREALFVNLDKDSPGKMFFLSTMTKQGGDNKALRDKISDKDFTGVLTGWFELVEKAQRSIGPPFYGNKQATFDNMFLEMSGSC